MASLRLKNMIVNKNSVVFDAIFSIDEFDEFDDEVDVYGIPSSANLEYEIIDMEIDWDGTTYTIEITLTKLSPGESIDVGIECWYYHREPSAWGFTADDIEYSYPSKSRAGRQYLKYVEAGADVYPRNSAQADSIWESSSGEKAYLEVFEWDYEAEGWESIEQTELIYTHPGAFYFKGTDSNGNGIVINQGDKYPINNIQELLINIYDFDTIATAWKRWKNQSNSSACNAFYEGNLSADMMNTAHNYLGTGKSYNPGDKISAEMFTTLENKLNN